MKTQLLNLLKLLLPIAVPFSRLLNLLKLLLPIAVLFFGIPLSVSALRLHMQDFLVWSQLLISWPVAVVAITLLLTKNFKEAIDFFIRNMGLKLPGGFEVQRIPADATPEPPQPSTADPEENLVEELSSLSIGDEERERLQNEIRATFEWMQYWRKMYLNILFVPNTKQSLLWLAQNQYQTRGTYNLAWQKTIPSSSDRDAILEALFTQGMITEESGFIKLTQDGYDFLIFTGLIPQSPQNNQTQ